VIALVRQVLRRPSREILQTLHQAISEFCGDDKPVDDMTTMVIKVAARG
jgi:hypothetical protein